MALNHVSGKKAHIRNRPTSSKYNTSCRDPHCCFQRAKLCSKALSKLVTCTPALHDSPRARKEASQRAKPHTARSELGNGECPLSAEAITCVRRSHTPHANGIEMRCGYAFRERLREGCGYNEHRVTRYGSSFTSWVIILGGDAIWCQK